MAVCSRLAQCSVTGFNSDAAEEHSQQLAHTHGATARTATRACCTVCKRRNEETRDNKTEGLPRRGSDSTHGDGVRAQSPHGLQYTLTEGQCNTVYAKVQHDTGVQRVYNNETTAV